MNDESRRGDQSTESQIVEELVAAAADGDRDAQAQLLDKYWPLIRQAVRGRKNRLSQKLAAREETQDLEQVVAIKLLNVLPKHTWRGGSAFAAWIKKLASNEVLDTYRRHGAQKRDVHAEQALELGVEPAQPARSAESRFDDHQKFESLMKQIQELKDEYGAALMMHHFGFTHAQIGEALGCTPEAARKLVARARRKLLELRSG
ncbi:MAG: sigma-70 family RNA polymerase sigma factor [Myxococcota bacterium]